MSADSAVGPAVLVNSFGKGKVLTFACSPDYATASEHHIVEARRLLVNAVRFLNHNPPVRIKAPVNVEVVVTDEPSERVFRIHLLAYNPSPQTTPPKNRPYILPGLIEDVPMYRISMEFSNPVKNVSSFNKSTNMQKTGQHVTATINDIHEIIIIKY
jgi:hypothetical protein